MDNHLETLRREITDWVTCPVLDRPVIQSRCEVPPRDLCVASTRPPIVNAPDEGEHLKCVSTPPTGGYATNIIGQPLCAEPWQNRNGNGKTEDKDVIVNTIGQRMHPVDTAKVVEDKAKYNVIGQRVDCPPYSEQDDYCKNILNPPSQEKSYYNALGQRRGCPPRVATGEYCERRTTNIIGQVVKPFDPRCDEFKNTAENQQLDQRCVEIRNLAQNQQRRLSASQDPRCLEQMNMAQNQQRQLSASQDPRCLEQMNMAQNQQRRLSASKNGCEEPRLYMM